MGAVRRPCLPVYVHACMYVCVYMLLVIYRVIVEGPLFFAAALCSIACWCLETPSAVRSGPVPAFSCIRSPGAARRDPLPRQACPTRWQQWGR